MKFIGSLIVVEDVVKSKYLYEKILKQKVIADFGENIAFEGFSIHQRKHFENLIEKKVMTNSSNFELYFEDDSLEAIEDIITEQKLEFIHKVIEQPWKQKALRFYDYDKNIIEIGETFEHIAYRLNNDHYSLDDISKITYMTKEKVVEIIEKYKKMKNPNN